MVAHTIIVVGVATGGLDPLRHVVEALPRHCSASVFVVMHGAGATSILPEILGWHGRLAVAFAEDGALIEPGHIYVAPPDRHMVMDSERIRLNRNAKVHSTRPAIDPLFISAAEAHGDSVVAIILSGAGTDGADGLAAVKAHGGCTLVQEPADAAFPSMPAAAIAADSPEVLHMDALARRVAEFCSHVHSAMGAAPEKRSTETAVVGHV